MWIVIKSDKNKLIYLDIYSFFFPTNVLTCTAEQLEFCISQYYWKDRTFSWVLYMLASRAHNMTCIFVTKGKHQGKHLFSTTKSRQSNKLGQRKGEHNKRGQFEKSLCHKLKVHINMAKLHIFYYLYLHDRIDFMNILIFQIKT